MSKVSDRTASVRADMSELNRKAGALEIIFLSPLWPRRDDLEASGKALFDAIIKDAKIYALSIIDDDLVCALDIAGKWAKLFNTFMDDTKIVGNEAAKRMVGVFRYYIDQTGIAFNQIA